MRQRASQHERLARKLCSALLFLSGQRKPSLAQTLTSLRFAAMLKNSTMLSAMRGRLRSPPPVLPA